jgi:hypothetical protein
MSNRTHDVTYLQVPTGRALLSQPILLDMIPSAESLSAALGPNPVLPSTTKLIQVTLLTWNLVIAFPVRRFSNLIDFPISAACIIA